MKHKEKKLLLYITILIVFIILSIYSYFQINQGIHLMLAWNALLAFIPVFIIFVFDKYQDKIAIAIVSFLIWFVFYPNSLYLITDLIYLDSDNYMISLGIYQGLDYLQDFNAYLAFFHLFIGALIGVVTSVFSFGYFLNFVKNKFPKYLVVFYFVVPLISSIGIYIGRFLRYNSWDLLNILSLVKDFFAGFNSFSIAFILMFSFIQYLIFGFIILNQKLN
jgi:uncharacterized membrane protein